MNKCLEYGKGNDKENQDMSLKHMKTVMQNLISWIGKHTEKRDFKGDDSSFV